MANQGWLCLGGVDLVNCHRSATYARNGFRPHGVTINPCGCCGTMEQWAAALNDAPYTNPKADMAPWYSATEPDSGDFAGLMVTSIEGLGSGPTTRSITQRANGRGGFIGPSIQAAPEITVTGILFGKTCCSVDYGLRWLGTQLLGECDSDCDGSTLSFLDCCPDFDACAAATPAVTPFDCLTPHLRYLENVQLVESPTITQRYGTCCGDCNGTAYMEVQFKLAAGSPCVHRDPKVLATDQPFEAVDPNDCDITWVLLADGETCPDDTECIEPSDCLADPDCNQAPAPPRAPAPSNPCICTSMNTRQSVVEIPAGSIPEYTEGVPYVTIKSGSKDLRQVRVRFWMANNGQTVDQLDPCATCGEVSLSKVPAFSEFTFDGLTRKATITCPGSAPTDATPLMGSAGGKLPVEWPEIACSGARFLMQVVADSDSVAPDATTSLSVYPTECHSSVGAG